MKMKSLKWTLIAVFAMVLSSFVLYQPVDKSQIVADWQRAKAYTLEYLDAMPSDQYSLKPTPEIRSFSEQMLHLANANYGFVSGATGATNPLQGNLEQMDELKNKEQTTKAVSDSYDFAIKAIQDLDPSKLGETVSLFGQQFTREIALAKGFEHQTHHRGQTTIYLRLGGVTPPGEKLF